MRKTVIWFWFLITLAVSGVYAQDGAPVTTHNAAPDSAAYQLVEVVGGLDRPLALVNAGDGSGRLFVLEQSGNIWIVENGTKSSAPFLDVSDLISRDVFSGGYTERGLLGMVFHPNYEENGQFYINYTDVNGDTMIARYQVAADNPAAADPASAKTILQLDQPFPNHNGGDLVFGPDGYLYIGLGDGGSAGDPQGNGQNPAVLLGKMLRLDVDGDDPYAIPSDNPYTSNSSLAPEVWAWGLRNPWRFSFDRATGDLYIADVGQNAWEEVNFQAADSPGGENYGWNVMEATHLYSGESPHEGMTMPFTEYSHSEGCSVTGGFVYRGEALPDLQGYYLFSDYCTGTVWASYRDEASQWQRALFLDTAYSVSALGEDEQGELYVINHGGTVLRLEAAS